MKKHTKKLSLDEALPAFAIELPSLVIRKLMYV